MCFAVDKPVSVYLKEAGDLPVDIDWKCAWWDQADDGIDGEEIGFLLVECINLDQTTILVVSQSISLSIYTNFNTLRIIWKFDLSQLTGSFRENLHLNRRSPCYIPVKE